MKLNLTIVAKLLQKRFIRVDTHGRTFDYRQVRCGKGRGVMGEVEREVEEDHFSH